LKEATAEAPASSANLGPGFDVFALALNEPRDRIQISAGSDASLKVEIQRMDGIPVSSRTEKNVAGVVSLAIAKDFGIKANIKIKIWKNVPIGIGIGSSGASAVAAVVAMNEAFNLSIGKRDMIYYAGKGEEVTSGTAHHDNVAASLMGGFVIVTKENKPLPITFSAPANLAICIATPKVELPSRKTEYSRSILPKAIKLEQMVENVANASKIVCGFALGKIEIIGEGMNDKVVEIARKKLIPGYDQVKSRAVKAGASGVCISGAGPSMLALVKSREKARDVLEAMLTGFRDSHVKATGFVTSVGKGARVIESK
jgi:homoserine kinase